MRGLAAAAVLLVAASGAARAETMEDYFGTWLPHDQPARCKDVAEWGEGPQIIIGKDHFEFGDSPPCEEVNMKLVGRSLRVGASCESGEAGYRAVVAEFELSGGSLLFKNRNARFIRCTP